MTTLTLETDYHGIGQDEAAADLNRVSKSIKRSLDTMSGKRSDIGRLLNTVRNSGMAMAAAFDIDSDERDWSDIAEDGKDGRSTAVSKYIDGIDGLTRQRANEYMQAAQRQDELSEAGIDTGQFVDSTFKHIKSGTDAAAFVAVVEELLADESLSKVTAAAFTAAGREAGIVAPANVGGGGDPMLKAANALLKAIVKAEGKVTATQKRSLKNVIAAAEALIG